MPRIKIYSSFLILLSINFLFGAKYFSRYTEWGMIIASGLVFIQVLFLYFFYTNKEFLKNKAVYIVGYGAVVFLIAVAILIHYKIPLESLNVDRYSVISSYLDNLFNDEYPYYAKSHMGNPPGPMPFYFIVAMPFYLIGELNLLSLSGYLVALVLILKRISADNNRLIYLVLILMSSPFLYWELSTRSNVFTFSLFVLVALMNSYKTLEKETTKKRFWLSSLLFGISLSTRAAFITSYIIFFIFMIRRNINSRGIILKYVCGGAFFFTLTFVPLVLRYPNDFFFINPFIIQASFLVPTIYTVFFIIISIGMGFLVKKKSDMIFYQGLVLFIVVLIYFIYHIIISGIQAAYFDSIIDISYFIFCLPFLYFFIIKNYSNSVRGLDIKITNRYFKIK